MIGGKPRWRMPKPCSHSASRLRLPRSAMSPMTTRRPLPKDQCKPLSITRFPCSRSMTQSSRPCGSDITKVRSGMSDSRQSAREKDLRRTSKGYLPRWSVTWKEKPSGSRSRCSREMSLERNRRFCKYNTMQCAQFCSYRSNVPEHLFRCTRYVPL